MNTLKTLLTSTLFASISFMGSAQAEGLHDDALYNVIHPESADIFNVGDYQKSAQYVNPADHQQAKITGVADVNHYMGSNPTAAGKNSSEVFIYNEIAGEYHLQ